MKRTLFLLFTLSIIQFATAQDTQNEIYKLSNVDFTPEFPGGYNAFVKYVGANFRMPEYDGSGGVLKMSFVVEIDGTVTNVKVIQEVGEGNLGNEAKRVISASPKWYPGNINGKKVRVLYEFPIKIADQSN